MNLSQIRQEADEHLQQSDGHFSHLVFIHSAIAAGASMLTLLISWLATSISPGGGLSNMDAQNMLSTIHTLFRLAITVATPMWQASLIFCTLRFIRDKECAGGDLKEGFRRWGPILSSLILRSIIYFGIILVSYFISCLIISFMPIPNRVYMEFNAFIAAPTSHMSAELLYLLGLSTLVFIVTLCCLLIPKLYFHRLVEYRIMDNCRYGGLAAILHSRILMKGHRKELFLLDLSFWWFYLLEAGVVILSVAYMFIPNLNMNVQVAAFASTAVALLAQLILYRFARPKLMITYALYYQQVCEAGTKETAAPQEEPTAEFPTIDEE